MNLLSVLMINILSIGYVQAEGLPNKGTGNDISMNLKEVYIDLDLKRATVKDLFNTVEEHTDFRFFYDNEVSETKYSFSFDEYVSLYDLLSEVSKTTDLQFRQVNKNINVKYAKPEVRREKAPKPAQSIQVIGKVNSAEIPEGIPFVNILVKGTSTGTVTDVEGNYSVQVPSASSVLVFTSVGFLAQEITVGEKRVINVVLKEDVQALEEVVVTGYGTTQKKESLVSSITSISPKDLKVSSSNLTTAFAGQIPGVISYQRSGEPGQDNSDFFIRGLGTFGSGKRDPLILIDNIESTSTDLARLQADDIEAFSVLKDATAAAVYGARGANGVILVNTKTGEEGKTKFQFRSEQKISTNTRNFRFADNISYMELENEAFLTRGFLNTPNNVRDIERTKLGDNPLLYPSNDWLDVLIKPYTWNQSYNMSASGGGKRARYYLAGTYNVDNGVLNVESINDFNNNIKLINYSLRSTVNIQLTKSLEGIIRVYGQFDDYSGPIGGKDRKNNDISGGQRIFNLALSANPVKFPAVFPKEMMPYVDHVLFGGAISNEGGSLLANPYAEMVRGYEVYRSSSLQPQLEFKQDLSFLTKGFSAGFMGYVKRYSKYTIRRSYEPFYYQASPTLDGGVQISVLNHGEENSIGITGRETLDVESSSANADSRIYAQSTLHYARTFNEKHVVTGFLIGLIQAFETGNPRGGLQGSLPRRNLGVSGKFTYGFDSRYLAEFNFGYNGTERFAEDNRFGFFPSVGVAYHISNESFWDPLSSVVDDLKFRASYGFVGNDQIGDNDDRFFYLSDIDLSNSSYSASFGEFFFSDFENGVRINRYANPLISWETSEQYNFGIDMTLFNSLDIVADVFRQYRTNILEERTYIGSVMGLNPAAKPVSNTGKLQSQGLDLSLIYSKFYRNKSFLQFRGNVSYSVAKVLERDEVDYPEGEEYRSSIGNHPDQKFGYVAERLFVDDFEVGNSPRQFGLYNGGDIKYRDINGDGIISEADRVPIGFPTTPEVVYGFGGTVGIKNLDIGIFFQGAMRTSFFIDSERITPFNLYYNGRAVEQNGLLKVIADSHWSEENRDLYAFWPRLSYQVEENNKQQSTWWMRNGAFLRLKNVEVGYTIPEGLAKKMHLESFRLYARGTNLHVWSPFKLWDPEMGGNGLGYPIQAIYAVGALLNF